MVGSARGLVSLVVQESLDDGADVAGNVSVDDTKSMDESVVIDRTNEFTLDIRGLVEAGGGARFHLHMERKGPTGSCQGQHDDEHRASKIFVQATAEFSAVLRCHSQ